MDINEDEVIPINIPKEDVILDTKIDSDIKVNLDDLANLEV